MSDKGTKKTGTIKLSGNKKTTADATQVLPFKRRRFRPVLIVLLVFVFILPTLVFMVLHYMSESTHDTESPYTSVLGETTEVLPPDQEEEVQEEVQTDGERLAYTEPPNEPDTLSLPERYPELFPDMLPDDLPEQDQEVIPRRPRVNPVGTGVNVAYLTFDDGPSREITPGILDILAEEGINATFFVLPREGVDDIYRRIINEGHEIGNHSFSHNYTTLYRNNSNAFKEDILKASEFISSNFNYSMTTFRFPGGSMSWNSNEIDIRVGIIEELGYDYFDWHIDSGDAHPQQADKSSQALTSIVLSNTNNIEHVIILMHDSGNKDTSLEALPSIIQGLREQGYSFGILKNYPGS